MFVIRQAVLFNNFYMIVPKKQREEYLFQKYCIMSVILRDIAFSITLTKDLLHSAEVLYCLVSSLLDNR